MAAEDILTSLEAFTDIDEAAFISEAAWKLDEDI